MKSKPVYKLLFVLAVGTTIMTGCGSSSGTRYTGEENVKTKPEEKPAEKIKEDFDFTPYRTRITINDTGNGTRPAAFESINAWYDYKPAADTTIPGRKIINKINGYRVQVLATDNLPQADSLRSELYLKTTQKQIYIIFDPPFYRVEVGDFVEISAARDLKFKLNQLGYSDARVVNEKVNIYQ